MNILDIAIAKQLAGGSGGSGTDNYNDLSNLPKINDTTLSGNKSSSALGLQSEINSDSKLASDLVDDTNQDNKFVTSTEKNTWNAKQNAIDADHKLSSDLVDDANKTNKFVTSTEKNTWNAKQNAIDADHKLSSSLVSFSTAEAAALASGIDSAKVSQISTNQTNILYALENGVKNSLVSTNGTTSFTGIMYTRNTDDSITVSGSNTASSRAVYSITSGNESEKAGHYTQNNHVGEILSLGDVVSDNDCYVVIFYSNNGSTWATEETVKGTSAVHVTIKNYPYYNICICVTEGKTISPTRTFYPMICPQSVYNVDPSYQPPALPNSDLTQLEAEDRAALAEEIDAGAKNIIPVTRDEIKSYNAWNWNGYTATNGGITYTLNADGSITMNGTSTAIGELSILPRAAGRSIFPKAGTYVLYAQVPKSLNPSGAEKVFIGVNRTVSGSGVRYGVDLGDGATFTVQSSEINDANGVWIGFSSAGITVNNVTIYPMICTKAAFGVSPKFVPFKYPYAPVLFKQVKHTFTTSDWERISELDFVVPNGYAAQITVGTQWRVGKATGVRIANSTTTFDNSHIIAQTDDSNGQLNISATGMAYAENNNVSLYVYAKHTVTAASDNFVNLCVIFSPTTL